MNISPVRVWRRNEQRRKHMGEVGVLRGFSVVRVAPTGLERHVPYVVGLVEVGGEMVTAQLVEVQFGELTLGMKLVGVLRRLLEVDHDGVLVYGVKFGPVREDL